MGILSLFNHLLFKKKSRKWQNTPEQFLAMILFFQEKNSGKYSNSEVLQWGKIMQKVLDVRLKPYRDFEDLLERGTPDYSLVDIVNSKVDEVNKRVELKKAIYGENVDLGEDDIMNSNSESAILTREIIEDLSKYVRFREDENNDS